MAILSLVKPLSRLRDEQQFPDEIVLNTVDLALGRGTITEVTGGASTGKTGLVLALLAQLTAIGDVCAVVDSCDSFDPVSAQLAGVELDNLLWVRCNGNVEQSFWAADYLVQAKGFGAIWLNFNGLAETKLRQVPRTYWYRYRTRIKETPTIFIVTAGESITGSASQKSFTFTREHTVWSGSGNFKLFREFYIKAQSRKGYYEPPVHFCTEFDYTEI